MYAANERQEAVTALAGGTGARLWTTGGFSGRFPAVLTVAGGVVCVGDENVVCGLDASTGGILYGWELTTGTPRWRHVLPPEPAKEQNPYAYVATAGDRFAVSYGSLVIAFEAQG